MDFVPLFDEQITIQKEAISSFRKWVVSIVTAGILIILLSLLLGKVIAGLSSDFIKIGGAFVSVLAALPYKEIINRREKVASYMYLKQEFENRHQMLPEDQQLLIELAKKMIEETMKR